MEANLDPQLKKWIKRCIEDEFSYKIDQNLTEDVDANDVAQKLITSKEMAELTNTIKDSLRQSNQLTKITAPSFSRPNTSLSMLSDVSGDDWSSTDEIGQLVDQMAPDKPTHVRLAGYASLKENEVAQILTSNSWEALLKILRDGLADDVKSVFEASLQIHAKLLNCPQFFPAYTNLLNTFHEQCQSKKLLNTLPTIANGVNFKVFHHERLFRMMQLIVDHQAEVIKGTRTADKNVDELIITFVDFLEPHSTANTVKQKPLNALNILSVLEPRANWTKRWMHSLLTRKIFCQGLGKSETLLRNIITCVNKGLKEPPSKISAVICDDPSEVFISGDSVESLTFFHCLHLVVELCKHSTGRDLLTSINLEPEGQEQFSVTAFLNSLLACLNKLASSDASNGVYEVSRDALKKLLDKSKILYDATFYQLTMSPLCKSDAKMWPHTLDILNHMLETSDGQDFLISELRMGSSKSEGKKGATYPVKTVLIYTSNVFKQSVVVMSADLVEQLLLFVGKLFLIHDVFDVIEDFLQVTFYPSISYFYGKLDKYLVENENKTQQIDKAVKKMLLTIVSIPMAFQMLSNEPVIFEEIVRGSIAPLRASWNDYSVVSFISNAGYLRQGVHTLEELAPHVLTTVLTDFNTILEDPKCFHDPWDNKSFKTILHVLSLFSLNTNCFIAFMSKNDSEDLEENNFLSNIYELLESIKTIDSPFHHLALLALKNVIWNLDIYIYLTNLFEFQNHLLDFQEYVTHKNEEDYDSKPSFIIDECSLLRHTILLDSYYVRFKRSESLLGPEDAHLFSKFPPSETLDDHLPSKNHHYDLKRYLEDSGSGLRDKDWVLQARKAFKASTDPVQRSVLIDLLEEMQKAIPIVEWVDHIKWNLETLRNTEHWLAEEERGLEIVIHYAEINQLVDKTDQTKKDLKNFIQSVHSFICFNKSLRFEGFDWFLSTIFLICNGDQEQAINFVSKIVHFPSAIFMWPVLAQVIDESYEEEASSKLIFAHFLENLVGIELPSAKYSLKSECGLDWWMICDRLLAQCFWGVLPWNEIVNYFTICILYTPDYIMYYCASLLSHCASDVIRDITKNKLWPENMFLEDYRCHSHIGFMERLGKKYGGKILIPLTQRKLNVKE